MRRAVVVLSLLALTAVAAGVIDRPPPLWPRGRVAGGAIGPVPPTPPAPEFQFAPAAGTGLSAACACTSVTGTQSEVITVSRDSRITLPSSTCAGMCTKHNTLENIANGDLVNCAPNTPRIMPGGDGGGVLGILVEPARRNGLGQSEDFTDTQYWQAFGAGVAAPTVTADQAVAPDGTMTADRLVIPATGAADLSEVFEYTGTTSNQSCPTSGTIAGSIYLRGANDGGTIDLCLQGAGPAWICQDCTYVRDSWTRCVLENVPAQAAGYFLVGNISAVNSGNVPRTIFDGYYWGAQCEDGANVTSYIPAGTTPSYGQHWTRAADIVTVALQFDAGVIRSTSLSVVQPTVLADNQTAFMLYMDGGEYAQGSTQSGKLQCDFTTGASASSVTSSGGLTAGVEQSLSCSYDGADKRVCIDGVCNTSAAVLSLSGGPSIYSIGAGAQPGREVGGVVKKLTASGRTPGACVGCSRVAWLGDSLSANLIASNDGTAFINPRAPFRYANLSGRHVDLWAVNGSGLTDAQTQWTNYGLPSGADRVVVLVGINDINTGAVGATLWASYQAWIEALPAQVTHLTIINLLPFGAYAGWDASKQTELDAFNSAMASYCAGAPPARTHCVDAHSNMWDTGNHNNMDSAYVSNDGLHLQQAGATKLGDLVYAVSP